MAIKASEILNLEVAGVDILVEKSTSLMWILEVNMAPGFTYDTKVSPELSMLAEFFKEELDKI